MKLGVILALVVGIALGVGAVQWYSGAGAAGDTAEAAAASPGASLAQAARGRSLAERVAALEAALDQSNSTQLDLFDQLLRLEELLENQQADRADGGEVQLSRRDPEIPRPRREGSRDPAERRRDRLLAYGFDEQTVERITQREGELRMEIMRQRYEAMQGNGQPQAQTIGSYRSQLREELGDDLYDRYLYASGRSNRVKVGGVISTSPAEKAGLRKGDVIVSYDGQRVFRMDDIVRLSHEGQAGESVSLEVERADGGRDTLYLPRGPLGMWSGGRQRVDPNK